ncbi:hypothetical protein DM02DRAFT_370567 [Periconia macrospinosa]|uniref:Uncharacterized protein n=1 Tax=Periconia macrospinosa TaxID=97972 RepID=A0A2V1DRP2_9PLEO|nr:hypothetical protein DM02DRAFT_370567 [Periconia macrospinosa]
MHDMDRGSGRGRQFLLDLYGAAPKVSSAETILTANITIHFPDNVRFERLTRYSLKLAITEPEVSRHVETQNCFPAGCETLYSPSGSPCWQPSLSNTPTLECGDGPEKDEPTASPCPTSSASENDTVQRPGENSRTEDSVNTFRKGETTTKSKRKASEQFPTRTMFENGAAFQGNTRLALDKFEHVDLELVTKRQKVARRVDSGIKMSPPASVDGGAETASSDGYAWMDEDLDNVTTKCFGNATAQAARPICQRNWDKKLNDETSSDSQPEHRKSRAYEASLAGSKIMPSLRKKGSVKRMVFRRSTAHSDLNAPDESQRVDSASPPGFVPEQNENTTPGLHAAAPLSQADIQRNYMDFLRSSCDETKATVTNNGEQQEFERIFMGDDSSVGNERNTDTDVDGDDTVSFDMEDYRSSSREVEEEANAPAS